MLICINNKYIVCDPTYINAPVGETMPDMDNQTAKVIYLQWVINIEMNLNSSYL